MSVYVCMSINVVIKIAQSVNTDYPRGDMRGRGRSAGLKERSKGGERNSSPNLKGEVE